MCFFFLGGGEGGSVEFLEPILNPVDLSRPRIEPSSRLAVVATHVKRVKEVGHTFVVMVCILPIFNSLWHHFGIVIFDA